MHLEAAKSKADSIQQSLNDSSAKNQFLMRESEFLKRENTALKMEIARLNLIVKQDRPFTYALLKQKQESE